MDNINITRMCDKEANKHKENLRSYGTEGKENTMNTSDIKEKSGDDYVRIYYCGKLFCLSTDECAYIATYISIIIWKSLWQMKNLTMNTLKTVL